MKVLSSSDKGKKGLSNIVAYSLLIAMALALSILVYSWLQYYVSEPDSVECPEGINLVFHNYSCNYSRAGADGSLNFTVQNKGRFSVDGYIIRANDMLGADFGFYHMEQVNVTIAPGEIVSSRTYNFTQAYGPQASHVFENLTLIEVQPFISSNQEIGDQGGILCKTFSTQRVVCH